jgi:hypothetical protein
MWSLYSSGRGPNTFCFTRKRESQGESFVMETLLNVMDESKKFFFTFSEHEKIILYKKYLKLESSTHTCKIKVSHHQILTNLNFN